MSTHFHDFLESLDFSIPKESLAETTQRIIQRSGLIGNRAGSNCQLVVGRVQSGKTLSFTSLIPFARDHGIPVVIILCGIQKNLLEQTTKRLRDDLRTGGTGGVNPWIVMEKVSNNQLDQNLMLLRDVLPHWNDENLDMEFKPTLIFTALKNREGMSAIIDIFHSLHPIFDVSKHPVLIIDDEADQAGLNLRWKDNEQSTVYSWILELRKTFKWHSYIMYTATPQGPLLINTADVLSPDYVTLLEPGDNYIGGEDLFEINSVFARIIPNHENELITRTEEPFGRLPSLENALAYFLLALRIAQKRQNPRPLSMLVHPDRSMDVHEVFKKRIDRLLESWETILSRPEEGSYEDLKRRVFLPAESEIKLTTTLDSTWDLDQALKAIAMYIKMKHIETRVENSDYSTIRSSDWKLKAGWIIVGGERLSRGFTIENLAVTYMPRGVGVGNADVIQQRGRFFGYKRKYLDLLRGWFFQDQIEAYRNYTIHEGIMREELMKVDREGISLPNWKRRFLIDPQLKLVRQNVISLEVVQKRLSPFKQHMLFDTTLSECFSENLSLVYRNLENLKSLEADVRSDRRHHYYDLEVSEALEILTSWRMSPENRAELDDIVWAISGLNDKQLLDSAHVVLMDWDPDKGEQLTRKRSTLRDEVDVNRPLEKQVIANMFQGPARDNPNGYKGDSKMKFEGRALTIQVHVIEPSMAGQSYPKVAALALLLPDNLPGVIIEPDFD